jgi:dihydrofolate synthase/folylpolyglutamate synthase
LGNTVKEIATEKAGIIKENTPVVVGPTTNEVKQLMRSVAELKKAPLTFANPQTKYKSALLGACQHENTATVVAAVNQLRLRNWSISETALSRGLAKVVQTTNLRGRWEQIATSPKVICDTGHNLHAMQTIAAQLQKEVYQNLWIVLGLVADKDVSGLLALMPRTAQYIFCQASIPRALNAEALAEKAAAFALKGRVVQNPKQALQKAQALANENDLIFVGGSTFVVAEIL